MAKTQVKGIVTEPTNGAKRIIALTEPYVVEFRIEGTSSILFHAWNCEAVEEKAASAKGSKAKKSDDLESYIYRNQAGEICLPGEYLRGSIINAAKFKQDPRSPRKSAMDLFKAAIVTLDDLCPLVAAGSTDPAKEWDFLDRRRVTIQRSAITRERPAFFKGWSARVTLQVLLPEYIAPDFLLEIVGAAGRLVGIGDFRPTFGRFQVTSWEVL